MPVPGIGPGEVLVRIEASGICGSDVMEWYRKKKAPLVLGHEIAGEIRDDPERWGPDAEARVLSRWSDQPSGFDGTTIRSWAEVMSSELAAARRE